MLTGFAHVQQTDSSLYSFSQETKDKLRKFRLGTSRASGPSAVICLFLPPAKDCLGVYSMWPGLTGSVDEINKETYEIRQEEDEVTYKSLEEIAEELPDSSPRFILLSYPMTLVCFVYFVS